MKNLLWKLLACTLVMTFGLAACDKKKEEKTEEAKPAEKADDMAAEKGGDGEKPTDKVGEAVEKVADKVGEKVGEVAGLADKDRPPLSMEEYKKLLLDHATCEIKNDHIDSKCPAVVALREAMSGGRKMADLTGGGDGLGRELIGHESPAVRIKAAGLMSSFLGTKGTSQDIIVEAAKKESHPAVLRELIRTVSNDGARNPKVAEMLLSLSNHSEATVRRAVALALSSTWNREMAGGPEKLIEMMTKDADMDVRAVACEYAGRLGDEKFMPAYTKLTSDKEEKIRTACTKGLIAMWWSFPFHENASQKAYQLTIKLLKKKPRDKDTPHWTVPGSFRSKNDRSFPEWQKKAPWFKQAELNAVLIDIIKDGNVNWMGRTGAVDSLVTGGITKADLEKLRKHFGDDPKGDDSHVVRTIDQALQKM